LIAVVGAFLAGQHLAGADPARPDLGSYVEDDLGQYHQCSDKPGGPSHCGIAFTAGGHTCRIVPTLAYAYCLDGDEGTMRLYGVKSTGAASVSTENVDGDAQDQALPSGHKLVLHAGGGTVECGAGDGSVSCQNGQGHGFNLDGDTHNTW
jgi:hypothetical protein